MGWSDKIFEKAVQSAFKKFDDDGSGYLEVDEVTDMINTIIEKMGIDFKADDSYVKYLIKAGDKNSDGKIGKDQIVNLAKTVLGQIQSGQAKMAK